MSAPTEVAADERGAVSRLPAPAARGATVVSDRAVARIATRAAREALTQEGGPLAPRSLAAPKATATSDDVGSVRVNLSLELAYPVDIARASRQIRDYVAERVARLTGLCVSEVTLTVQQLVSDGSLNRGRVR